MTIENKYGISRETVQRLVNDGIIPTSVKNRYEILEVFERKKNDCPSCKIQDLMYSTADQTHESFENVKKIIYKFGKK